MLTKLSTEQAFERYHYLSIAHTPFNQLPGFSELNTKNKGFAGQWLEKLMHFSKKPLSNDTADFLDGDLKTFPVERIGEPKETISITTISSMMDDIVNGLPFEETKFYHKIQRMLLVPIHKPTKNHEEWSFLDCIYINLENDTYLFNKLKKEYEDIAASIRYGIMYKKTFSELELRREFLEIRTKDSKPYKPIVIDGFEHSNKGRAFFFKKPCIRYFLQNFSS